jgi:hypothetical protein
MRPTTAMPPITPPIIAPIFDEEDDEGVGGTGEGVGVGDFDGLGGVEAGETGEGGGPGGSVYTLLIKGAHEEVTGVVAGVVDAGKFKLPAHFKPFPPGDSGSNGQSMSSKGEELDIQTTTTFRFLVPASHSIQAFFPNAAES